MKHNALTNFTAKNLPKGKHADGQGLWLVKKDRERGKWILRLVLHGARREMGLGRWPDVSIAEARRTAETARITCRAGSDPIVARTKARRAASPLTVRQAVQGCFESRKAELKGDGENGQWMSPLSVHVLPRYGSFPIEQMDQHVLRDLLKPLWNTKPDVALKALYRLNLTLKYAAALGLNVDLQAPMKARALLGKQRKSTEHIPSMPYEDAPAFFQSLGKSTSALALKFLILTVARTTEVRCAPFSEFADDIWNLPAERTKTNIARRIPLVMSAKDVVAECRKHSPNEHLFTALRGKPISDMTMAKLMKDRGLEARPHGFRATFRTWVEEQTDTPFEVKEAALGHAVDAGVVAAYQRSDRLEKRRTLLTQWEHYLLS